MGGPFRSSSISSNQSFGSSHFGGPAGASQWLNSRQHTPVHTPGASITADAKCGFLELYVNSMDVKRVAIVVRHGQMLKPKRAYLEHHGCPKKGGH
jgi:hypothetical protein